ncbi:MAG: tyrosine-protein phosphatase, partial [Lachnospiraceae bacterium]|nr:tyrosine-protein phosphatase [Lachnospiraceae bacterium]
MNRMITFENLNNIRDLGGLRGAGGRRIRPGKLFRGGNLNGASEADIEKLSGMLEIVVDFRTEGEIREKPDPEIPGVFNWHLPVLQTLTEGVTREKDADAHAFMKFMADPDAAFHYMCKTYEHVAKSPFACEQQKRLLEKLLNPGEKGVLWHCTAGKDRTGGFAAIIEEILGVSRDDIVEDYLISDENLRPQTEGLVSELRKETDDELLIEQARILNSVLPEYVDA